jgi:hypothetical protein
MFAAFKLWYGIFYWIFLTRNRSGRWVFPTTPIPMAGLRLTRERAKAIYLELLRSDQYLRQRAQQLNDWSMAICLTMTDDCVWIHFYPLHLLFDFPMCPEDERWMTYVTNVDWPGEGRTVSFLIDPELAEIYHDIPQWNKSQIVQGWYELDECLAAFKVTAPSENAHDIITFRQNHPTLYQTLRSKPTV